MKQQKIQPRDLRSGLVTVVSFFLLSRSNDAAIGSGQIIFIFLEGKCPKISDKSRLVKYYSIWPDRFIANDETKMTDYSHGDEDIFGDIYVTH